MEGYTDASWSTCGVGCAGGRHGRCRVGCGRSSCPPRWATCAKWPVTSCTTADSRLATRRRGRLPAPPERGFRGSLAPIPCNSAAWYPMTRCSHRSSPGRCRTPPTSSALCSPTWLRVAAIISATRSTALPVARGPTPCSRTPARVVSPVHAAVHDRRIRQPDDYVRRQEPLLLLRPRRCGSRGRPAAPDGDVHLVPAPERRGHTVVVSVYALLRGDHGRWRVR